MISDSSSLFRPRSHSPNLFWVHKAVLIMLCLIGLNGYARQFAFGLGTTGINDTSIWGVCHLNAALMTGIAISISLLNPLLCLKRNPHSSEFLYLSLPLGISVVAACYLFTLADLGRPEKMWHLMPGVGELNYQRSGFARNQLLLAGLLLTFCLQYILLLYARVRKQFPSRSITLSISIMAPAWVILVFFTFAPHSSLFTVKQKIAIDLPYVVHLLTVFALSVVLLSKIAVGREWTDPPALTTSIHTFLRNILLSALLVIFLISGLNYVVGNLPTVWFATYKPGDHFIYDSTFAVKTLPLVSFTLLLIAFSHIRQKPIIRLVGLFLATTTLLAENVRQLLQLQAHQATFTSSGNYQPTYNELTIIIGIYAFTMLLYSLFGLIAPPRGDDFTPAF